MASRGVVRRAGSPTEAGGPTEATIRGMRRGIAAVGLAASVLSGCVLSGCGRTVPGENVATSTTESSTTDTSTTATTVTATTSTATTSTAATSTASTTATTSTAPTASGYSFPYQPMWPFAGLEDADRWLREGRPAGNDPWHADPRATALKFTREFLAFTDLDRTTTMTEQPREAWVGVGQADPKGTDMTVANLHLARLGPAADAPWVVVGSEDTELTLEKPSYGSPTQPVIEVGGTISGVDESLHVQARQASELLGEFCCVPAGGQKAPWSATLPIAARGPGVVTVVVSTGGHYAQIERFAVTALRAN